MRAILEDLQTGKVAVHEIPPPELRPGGIIVQTHFSVISSGTERASVEVGQKSLLGKAMARPDLVRQVIDYARKNGVRAAYQKVQSRLGSLLPLGCSCAGVVVAVGEGANDFAIGDRVACGGAGLASHSEVNFVPQNLAVAIPASVPLEHAAITTIGAIAMQGLRQSGAAFGETVLVIGAGLVGILSIQLAKAAGCRVIAIDKNAQRAAAAQKFGADLGLASDRGGLQDAVRRFSAHGPDVALITAAAPSTEPVELAAELLRDRGRIVIVGDVGIGAPRTHVYAKELSIVLSRSYGPGRYDPLYEEAGVDYPVGYVRWTERRNMEAFVQFLACGAVNVAPLLERRVAIEQAGTAHVELAQSGAYTALIEYPAARGANTSRIEQQPRAVAPLQPGAVRIGCIGAGNFARSVILPHLRQMKQARLEAIAASSGASAESVRRQFAFARAEQPSRVTSDANIDAVFVLSRHSSHAKYVADALRGGKAVFVEKPLAITPEELESVQQAWLASPGGGRAPFVMVGFNRRFAPLTCELREFFAGRAEPMMLHARINAGFIPLDHWSQQPGEGGRIVGELCHFVDWARFVTAAPIREVRAVALPDAGRYNQDNLAATLTFDDGSIASLIYIANGDTSVSKEFYEVFCGGAVARLDDFCSLELTRNGKTRRSKSRQDKGHARELDVTLSAWREGRPAPIAFEELCEVTAATFAIQSSLTTGHAVKLADVSRPASPPLDESSPQAAPARAAGAPQ